MKKLILTLIYSVMIIQPAFGEDLTDGYYNEYYLGMKSGGPWAHSELKNQITSMLKDGSLSVLCITGPDSTVSSYVEIEQYRKSYPKAEISSTCKGGGWVYVGPYLDIESAKDSRIYYTGAMLHTIDGETLLCKSSACVVVKEQPNNAIELDRQKLRCALLSTATHGERYEYQEMNLACPSCGFLTIEEEAYGTYTICEVCGWEDDQVQLANPVSCGGANSESLYESQLQALKKVPLEVKEYEGICRSLAWRPLNQKEVEEFSAQSKEKHWANKGILYESEVYWVKNS